MNSKDFFKSTEGKIDYKNHDLKGYILIKLRNTKEDIMYPGIYMYKFDNSSQDMGDDFEEYLSKAIYSINEDINSIITILKKELNYKIINETDTKKTNNFPALKASILSLVHVGLDFQSWISINRTMEEIGDYYPSGTADEKEDFNRKICKYESEVKEHLKDNLNIEPSDLNISFTELMSAIEKDRVRNKINQKNIIKRNNPNYGKYWADRTAKDENDTPGGWFDN